MDNPVASASLSAKNVKRWLESFVPEYLVMDILSRLRLKNVVQCRCVCKRWRDLLSTPEFAGFYKERGGMGGNVQMILVDEPKIKSRIDHFFLDEWQFRMKPIVRRIHTYPSYRTEFSQEGFLVMSSICSHSILIVNPIESDGLKILCSSGYPYKTNAYGIFFNPTLKEHCVLFGVMSLSFGREDPVSSISYRMLVLGAQPSWRYLSNPFNCKPKFQMSTTEWARPVLVGDYLYWLVVPMRHDRIRNNTYGESLLRSQGIRSDPDVIMEFNTRTEEFTLIQHVPQSQSDTSSSEIGLMNIDGFLSLVRISTSLSEDVEIDIWTLKDRVAQSWTRSKYYVSLDGGPSYVSLDVDPFIWFEGPKPIAVVYGELIFQSDTTLFACNLKGKTTRICGKKKYNKNTRFFCHSISLLSLKKCKTVICMEGVDEKEYKERCEVCSKLFKEETSSAGVNKHSVVVEEPSTSHRDDASASLSAKKVKTWLESFVPDHILVDILSRLRLKNVIQCRCVCKRWRDLLSTPEFAGFHKERGGMGGNVQMILVDEPKRKSRIDQFFLDEWQFRMKPIIRRIHSYPSYRTEFSQEGFLVMSSVCSHSILIVNPMESDGVKIFCPSGFGYKTNAYGIFFNPTLKEHCVLFGVTLLSLGREDPVSSISYRMLILGAQPCWRYLSNPFNCKPKVQTLSMEWVHPVLVGDYLYWLVVPIRHDGIRNRNNTFGKSLLWSQGISRDPDPDYIMEFNTRTEEFTLIRHVPQSQSDTSSSKIGLMNIDGFLSSVRISTSLSEDVEIDILTLKDRVAQSWTRSKYYVSVYGGPSDVSLEVDPSIWFEGPKPIAVENGELIFQSDTTLFACNLKGKTTRICGKKKYNKNTRFFCHSMSLLSLKKCKTMICMEGVDEKEYKERCEVCSKLFKEETSSARVNNNKHSDVVEEPSTSYIDDGGGCKSGTTSTPEQINPTSSGKL